VLDLHLPGLGGDTILNEIAASPVLRDIPVIVVTGGDAQTAIVRAKAILRKPCVPTRLVSLVERHLGRAA
jgi:CheY-like chemotaxis protein